MHTRGISVWDTLRTEPDEADKNYSRVINECYYKFFKRIGGQEVFHGINRLKSVSERGLLVLMTLQKFGNLILSSTRGTQHLRQRFLS